MDPHVIGAGVSPVRIVSRAAGRLEAFSVGIDGGVYTTGWRVDDPVWCAWKRIGFLEVAPCAPLTVLAGGGGRLDVWAVGIDGRIQTSSSASAQAAWSPWVGLAELPVPLHAGVAAALPRADRWDVFVADLDGLVHQTSRFGAAASWGEWVPLPGVQTAPGAPVSALSAATDEISVFVMGQDGVPRTIDLYYGNPDLAPGRPAPQRRSNRAGLDAGWQAIHALQAHPRATIEAVSRGTRLLDIAVVGADSIVQASSRGAQDADWRAWRPVGSTPAAGHSSLALVARSPERLDACLCAADGSLRVATWRASDDAWCGWSPVAIGTFPGDARPGLVARAADRLDVAISGIDGAVMHAAWCRDSSIWTAWSRLGDLVGGQSDPQVSEWQRIGQAFASENTSYSEEAQGMTTDGQAWFLVSNGNKTLRRYAPGNDFAGSLDAPDGDHVGAPGCHAGWVYVPIQRPAAVWKVSTDMSQHSVTPVDGGDDLWPWCDVNPLNGRLYTCEYDAFQDGRVALLAYDRNTIERRPDDDLLLAHTPIECKNRQGGVFTRHGRLILSRSGTNGLFCFSSLTGWCFGAQKVGNFGSRGSEVEGVTVREWSFGNRLSMVQLLELDNDTFSEDDCYLHSYAVPDPGRL
jgi:hypothetical protein